MIDIILKWKQFNVRIVGRLVIAVIDRCDKEQEYIKLICKSLDGGLKNDLFALLSEAKFVETYL